MAPQSCSVIILTVCSLRECLRFSRACSSPREAQLLDQIDVLGITEEAVELYHVGMVQKCLDFYLPAQLLPKLG